MLLVEFYLKASLQNQLNIEGSEKSSLIIFAGFLGRAHEKISRCFTGIVKNFTIGRSPAFGVMYQNFESKFLQIGK